MGADLAAANVNRAYSLAAPSIAIFTFMLIFLYPRFEKGAINAWLFQAMFVVMGVATFSFVLASLHYYRSSLGSRIDDAELALLPAGRSLLKVNSVTPCCSSSRACLLPRSGFLPLGLCGSRSGWRTCSS